MGASEDQRESMLTSNCSLNVLTWQAGEREFLSCDFQGQQELAEGHQGQDAGKHGARMGLPKIAPGSLPAWQVGGPGLPCCAQEFFLLRVQEPRTSECFQSAQWHNPDVCLDKSGGH